MWSPSSLVATAFLASSLLFQHATSLSIFRDLDELANDPDAPPLLESSLRAMPPWEADRTWTKRSENDLTMLDPTDSEGYHWGGPRSTFLMSQLR